MEDRRFYDFDEFRVDVVKRSLSRQGSPIQIPPKTFDLLLLLLKQDGDWISRDQLMEQLWSGFAPDSNNVDQHLSRLRKILAGDNQPETEAARRQYIKTERGLGVRFQLPDSARETAQDQQAEPNAPSPRNEIQEVSAISPASANTNWRAHIVALSAGVLLLMMAALIWMWQRQSASSGTVAQSAAVATNNAFPRPTRQEIHSPSDAEEVKRVVEESQMLETLIFYGQPHKFDREILKKYWLPTHQGGKAIVAVEDSIKRMLEKKQHYGSESRCERFEFRYVRIFSPRDYAEVGTVEQWFVPRYNEDGSQVLNRNVRLGPYAIDYTLRKIDGAWLLEENSTPRASQYVIPSPSPVAR